MKRRLHILFELLVSAIGLVVLAWYLPDSSSLRAALWLTFAAAIAAGWTLSGSAGFTLVPTLSTMAYLTLGQSAGPALWAAAVGGLTGLAGRGLIWPARGHRLHVENVMGALGAVAQTLIALLVAHHAYSALTGALPMREIGENWLPLAGLAVAFGAVDVAIVRLRRALDPEGRDSQLDAISRRAPSLLALPLAALGSMLYHSPSREAFALLLGTMLALGAGVAWLERAWQLGRRAAPGSMGEALAAALPVDAALVDAYRSVLQELGPCDVTVALLDATRELLHFPLNISGSDQRSLEPRPLGRAVLDHVILQGRPLLLPDRVAQRAKTLGLKPPRAGVRSWIGVPLRGREGVLGALAVASTAPSRTFTVEDVRSLAGIASVAARTLELASSSMDERRSLQFATLNNVMGVLSGTLDMQQVLDLVVSSALAVGAADGVGLYLWPADDNRTAPELVRQTGIGAITDGERPVPLMLDYDLEDLARRRQPLVIADVDQDQRARPIRAAAYRAGKRAWAEFLLRRADDLLGVLVLAYAEPRQFAAEEIELLRNFTSQAALAISNARLYTQTDEALQRRVEQLSALADTSRELTSTLNLPRLFQVVLDRALEATESQTGALLLIERSDGEPVLVAARGFAGDDADLATLSQEVAANYNDGQPVVIEDVRSDPSVTALASQTRSQMIVPIVRGGDVLGVIALGSERPASYSDEDRSFVSQLATQARIAIDNARLFQRTEIARDRLQVILDSMVEGVILVALEGEIALANPRIERLLGLPPARITGHGVEGLLQDPALQLAARLGFTQEGLRAQVADLRQRRWDPASTDQRAVFRVEGSGKTHVIERNAAPVRDEAGRVAGLLLVFHDVTEEQALAQAREDLSSMIVHDLRGPLTAINASFTLLHELGQDDDALGGMILRTTHASRRAVRKLLNLVDSLLDISKLESGAMALDREPTALAPICSTVVEEIAALASELDVALKLYVRPELPLLDVDADMTERILLNLVDNAMKYTPAGGSVCVEAAGPTSSGDDGSFVRVNVRDTGPGIPDEFKQRLFDRYVQIDRQRGRRRGTGLGLAFCKMAVEAHGGRIWVEENPSGGAVVAFTLPIARLPGEGWDE